MIFWITGNTGAGKSTLASWMRSLDSNAIILDGNELRSVWHDLDLSKEGRWEQNLRIARLAKALHRRAQTVIAAVICPYHDLRKEVQRICGCEFIYLYGGKDASDKYPYKYREKDEYQLK